MVVVFPTLEEMNRSAKATGRVAAFFRHRGVTAIDLGEILTGRDTAELVVSALDTHPNERLHREVADLLYQEMEKAKIHGP